MTPTDVARCYIRRGWAVTPVPHRKKRPVLKEWEKLRISEAEAPRYFNGHAQNIGVLLGEPSGHLVDVDLDCSEARALADRFLPSTESVFGRPGNPASHRLYLADVPKVIPFDDPEGAKERLLELRSTGGQTVFPGSVHESGEAIAWHEDGDPERVDGGQLTMAAGRLAAACLLVRAAPAAGRHEYFLDVSGALVRGLGEAGAAHLLHPVARAVLGNLFSKAEGERLIADTARKIAAGDPATGWPTLAERLGEKRARKLSEWLGLPSVEHGAEQAENLKGSAAEPPWPDPDFALLRPHRRHAPELPLDVFGPAWARWIADAAEAKGAPPDFVALPLLGAVGAMVANARRGSPWPGWVEPPIVWVANVGLPSSGKSPAQDAVMDLVRELEHELDLDFDERSREHLVAREVAKAKRERWEAEVRAALKNDVPPPDPPREAEPPEPPARRRLFTVDATVERLARIAAANDRGVLLARDELAGWLGGLDKYGGHGGDRAFYLEAHGGRPHVIDRMKDGAPVRVPFLSVAVLGGIQPDRLASLLFAGDDDGCAARFLFAWPEPRRPQRPGRAPDDAAALGSLRWLLALGQESTADGRQAPKVLPLDPAAADALQVWREQVAELEAGASGLFCSWLGKLPGLAVRVALVLELLWWCRGAMGAPEPQAVSPKATHAALALLEAYALPMARRAFGEAALPQADRDAVALARWLRAREPAPETVNARELRHADALPTREAERYDRALAELEAAGWLRPAPPQPGPGRRRKDWLVNPKLYEGAR